MTNAEARMPNEVGSSNGERTVVLETSRQAAELPPVGQFSLRTLLITSAVAAVACALLAPIVRHWPSTVQLEFAISITVYFAILALAAVGFVMSSRRAEKDGGRLLLFLPGRSPRRAAITFVVFTGGGWLLWFLQVDLAVMADEYTTGAGLKLFVLVHGFNSANFVFAGTRGVQFREHAIVTGNKRVEWSDISRYSWGPHSTLVLLIKSVRAAAPIGIIKPEQRAAVEIILEHQLAQKSDAAAG